jgi:hypothetical protein
VLVRTEGGSGWFSDLVAEHRVFVDFTLTWQPGDPVQVRRTSGSRDDMKSDLLARGLCVLGDDEPLAIAHREVEAARRSRERSRPVSARMRSKVLTRTSTSSQPRDWH